MNEPRQLTDRAVVRLTGDERRSFLQGIITQDMDRLTPETAVFSALLTPQGKILTDFFVAETDNALLIDCDRVNAPALIKRLSLYKLRAKVSIDLDESLCVIAGDEKPSIERAASYRDPRHEQLGWRTIDSAGDYAANEQYDSTRIALGIPEFGRDFGPDEMFLLDVNYDALNAVSYKKGCFIGQEVSSRMKRKGEVRRRTLIAEFKEAAPEKGTEITAGAAKLGELMSCAGNLALASIRMDRWQKAEAENSPVECGGMALHLRVPEYLEQG